MGFKEFLQSLGYTEEQITAIIDGMKTNKIYLSKEENIDTRYEKLKGQKVDLETQLATANKTIEDLKKANKDNEALQTKVTEYETEITRLKDEATQKDFNYRLEDALKSSKAKNIKAIKALLDLEKVKVEGDKLTGLDEQLITLKESDSYLFDVEEQQTNLGGPKPTNQDKPPQGFKNPWSKEHRNLTEQARILRENPKLAEQLKNLK